MMMDDKKSSENREIMIPVSGPEEKDESGRKGTVQDKKTGSGSSRKEYIDQLQRLQAEFSNYRKRVNKERESFFSMAKGKVVLKLLPVLDDLERMLNHHREGNPFSVEGVRLIYQNLRKILSEEGLEEIPALGEVFDPECHEAVGVEDVDEDRDGLVVEEWQKGYRFVDRLLRPSRVKVGKTIDKTGDA